MQKTTTKQKFSLISIGGQFGRFIKNPALLLDFCLNHLWFPLGWSLNKIPGFKRARDKKISSLYHKNTHIDLREESILWYHLNRAYTRYLYHKYRNLPQEQYQQKRWDDYAELYYALRASDKVNQTFYTYFKDAIERFSVSSVLDIGCGGWNIERSLCEKYPKLNFMGIDITDKSLEIYNNEINKAFKNTSFIKGSIFQHLYLFKQTQLCFSYNVFMHFDEAEMKLLFNYIANLPHRIIGILQEPYTEDAMTKPYPSALKDYCHNFKSYILNYNFKLINIETSDNFGIFYFTTK